MDQAGLKNLLQEALTSDTERVKAATAKLKHDYFKHPQSLSLLLQITADDDSSSEIRQIAATQARALVPRHWDAIPEGHKPQIRQHLMQATLQEEKSIVRHNTARVVAAIAKVDAEDGQWADLPQQLLKISSSGDAKQREVGTYLLFTILDVMGEESSGQFVTLFQLFSKTIHDSESAEVRINTMLALSKIALVIDPDTDQASLQAFQKVLPDMVGVLKQTIDAHDEERTLQSFEVFQTLLEADPRLLNKYFGDLVNFMAEAASATNLDKDARVAALNFLVSCVLYRKLKFQALRVGEQMVDRMVHILFTSDDTPAEEEEFGLTISVLSLLSLMSSQLPPSQAVVPTLKLFKQFATASDPKQKRAVLTAFAACVEGAPEFLDTQVEDIKPLVLQLLNDSDLHVREAAVSVTKELAEALPEAIGKDHQKFMAGVARNLNAAMSGLNGEDAKTNKDVVVHCCAAIDNISTGLEPEDLQPYLAELVPHISRLFSHPEHNVKAAAIGAVGSIAQSAKDGFLPFFEDTMSALQEYVQVKEGEEEMNLRSMTCDAMGDMAMAVGPDAFKRYVQPLMQATEEGLHLDNPRLKETSYMFWGTMAGVYKEDFKPFLAGAVKSIFEALDQKEAEVDIELGGDEELVGQEVIIGGKKVKVVEAAGGDEDDDDDDELDDIDEDIDSDDEDWADIAGISAVSQEKEVATEALGEIFSNVGSEYLPYFEETIKKVLLELESAYEGLRRSAVSTLFRAYATIFKLNDTEFEPGLPLKHKPSNELSQFGEVLMTATLALWMAEDDENVVMEVNTNLAETLKLTGPAIISSESMVEQVVQTLVSILTKKHLSQQSLEDDEEDEDDLESSEDEMTLISSAMDTVAGLSAALGPQFSELWKVFEKTILGYASATEPGYRSASIGSVAECIRGMGSGVTPHTPTLLKVILHRLGDEDSQVKSNAAFAAGVLVEHSENADAIVKAYPQILSKLEPLLHAPQSRQLDNAAGCVARMILQHPGSLPLDEVLPALVNLLPLKEDFEENIPVYQMLYKMFDSEQGRAMIDELGLRQKLKPIFAAVLGEPERQLTDTTRDIVMKMAGAL